MLYTSRWLAVPLVFSAFLWGGLIIRWTPAALAAAKRAGSFVPIVIGDMALLWPVAFRGFLALVLTLPALFWLPPLSRREVFVVSAFAVVAEVVVELTTSAFLGASAPLQPQLVATGCVYVVVMIVGGFVLRNNHARGAV
jgi:hypothetical protein